ncbi:hypothetical protein Tco_0636399 [Tanacetum coccineum]
MDQTIQKSHVEKPKKFKGFDFCHLQQKMLFYLTSLHVSYVLTNSEPIDPYVVDGPNVSTEVQMASYERAASQWNHNEYNCKNYILNALDDSLHNIYSTFATAREIWKSLEKKYMTQVAYNKINEKADANSIEPNANMVGESSSKSKSNQKNKGKNGSGSRQKQSKDEKKDYTQKRATTSRKSIIVGSVGNLGTKLRIVSIRKSMEVEILEEILIKQTMWNLQKNLLELLDPS